MRSPAFRRLCAKLQLPLDTAHNPFWSAAPDFLQLIVETLQQRQPQRVVECSSGTSTVVLARGCQLNGSGHIYSLEHDVTYADKTRQELARLGLSAWATVIDAPLRSNGQWQWYSLPEPFVAEVEMVVVDGPPGRLQPLSRYPALGQLRPFLAQSGVLFLDDAARQEERQIVERWEREFNEIVFSYLPLKRGAARGEW
ncbi:class I SAM-dependent methyltransferase [Ectothiorhodospiraceae bacterium BW-2]|nr:class I SAM-dependent methyltransferase [Ectothiorhodospiraceae bacterium BW-2]